MTDMTVARTILAQLGGNRFLAMTGAKNLLAGDDHLFMTLPASMTKGRAGRMRITLADDDTYTIELMRMRSLELIPVDRREGVTVDMLRAAFTDMTGLDTSLGRAA